MAGDVSVPDVLEVKAKALVDIGPPRVGKKLLTKPPRRPAAETRTAGGRPTSEAIIRWYRPVLTITDDRFVRGTPDASGDARFVDPSEGASDELLAALEAHRNALDSAIPSVGRLELANNAHFPWVGTGWIVDCDLGSDIIITNAHVAREFAMHSEGRLVFRPGIPDPRKTQSAIIDFREELSGARAREFPITDVIWISDDRRLDMALLRVARTAGADSIRPPITISTVPVVGTDRMLAVVGYPGSGGGYDPEPFERLFGRLLGKKRFSPGLCIGTQDESITYDASTLPGSSGSVVLDIETGTALGLHFAGTVFEANYAVPAGTVLDTLRRQPWRSEAVRRPIRSPTNAVASNGQTARFVIPLEITVRLGELGPQLSVSLAGARETSREAAEAAARLVRSQIGSDQSVLVVEAGYLFDAESITDDYGVIVGVRPGASLNPLDYGLGTAVEGVPLSVEFADPETVVARNFGVELEAFGGRRASYVRDLTDPRFGLDPVTGPMRIVLHASPEAGWSTLREFLGRKDANQLTIGMYHMTAPHVVDAIKAIARRAAGRITLTLDRQRGTARHPDDTDGLTKSKDIPEATTLKDLKDLARDRFEWAPASLGAQGLFASAYHIKVAVWSTGQGNGATGRAFWLSSGNWQSSNQAPLDPARPIDQLTWDDVADYNREWHAVVEHEGLAKTLRNHLEQDYRDNSAAAAVEGPAAQEIDVLVPAAFLERPRKPREFRAFAPLILEGNSKVQVLLTPDNYPEVIAELIRGAKDRILIENQSFNLWKEAGGMPDHFIAILDAIKQQQRADLDVRIIFRSSFGNERQVLRRIKEYGLRADRQHVRHFATCHTKGFVIDDEIAVLGSQNITAAGTGPNRDASLVIWDKRANAYFADLFEYDWAQVAEQRPPRESVVREGVQFVNARLERATPAGYRRVSLAEFLGET